ncbi:hypothetical protein E2C01_052584 [Portunus trituberculatus]|uniref:Uncharacterized protein n=1 Tax=Portunus trituberculatus TaxID=210409 RepID=A0A5B7GMV7_PORTR|nr:hypothetical protein [Portunus trituberculatus]
MTEKPDKCCANQRQTHNKGRLRGFPLLAPAPLPLGLSCPWALRKEEEQPGKLLFPSFFFGVMEEELIMVFFVSFVLSPPSAAKKEELIGIHCVSSSFDTKKHSVE